MLAMTRKKMRMDVWFVITIVLLLLYILFLIYPLGNLFKMAFHNGEHFTLDYFITFFTKKYYTVTIANSFKVSTAATIVSMIVGVTMGYFYAVYEIKLAKTVRMCVILATMSAPFVGAYAWILLLGRNGAITVFLQKLFPAIEIPSIYGFGGILLVFTTQLFPLVFLYIVGAMSKMDNSLMEASLNMGCSGIRRFFKVIIPLIMPSILASALLVFIRALSDFGTPLLLGEGYRTFPVALYNEFVGEVSQNKGFASAIAIVAILITCVIYIIQNIATAKTSFAMNALNPVPKKKLKGLPNILVHFYIYLVTGIAILPQVYVTYCSFRNTSGQLYVEGYSLDSYRDMFGRLGRSVLNTITIPLTSLVFVLVIAVLIAYISVRRRNALTSTVDMISMIPYIIPGTVVGIAMVTSFNKEPLILTATTSIMIISLVIRRLPYTIRSSVATLQQIPISIEEAAISLGSSKLKTFVKITVPMMSSGIIAGAILSWVTLITELSTAIFLYTSRTQTLTVAIYTQIVRGHYGVASAMATLLTLITIVSMVVFNLVNPDGDVTL